RDFRRSKVDSLARLLRDRITRSRWSYVDETSSMHDPVVAARLAELEALVEVQHAALEEERAARANAEAARAKAEAERDRLREADEALTREVELARRRLVVAKAERVDTTQLELEFAAKLADLDKLSRQAEDEIGEKPERERKQTKDKQQRGRRDLRLLEL